MHSIRIAFGLAIALLASSALALEPLRLPPEMRRHQQVRTKDGTVLYTVTSIHRFAEKEAETIILVRDDAFIDLIFRGVISFEKQFVFHRLSDVRNETYVQRSYRSGLGAKTWSELRKLMHEQESARQAKVVLKIESNGGEWESSEEDRENSVLRRERVHNVRNSMTPSLLEVIERMRGTLFGTEAGNEIYIALAFELLYDVNEEAATSTNVSLTDESPDCAFDKSFGYPCTESQLARIKQAAQDAKPLRAYW